MTRPVRAREAARPTPRHERGGGARSAWEACSGWGVTISRESPIPVSHSCDLAGAVGWRVLAQRVFLFRIYELDYDELSTDSVELIWRGGRRGSAHGRSVRPFTPVASRE